MIWVLEQDTFPHNHTNLDVAAKAAGHKVIPWDHDWDFARIPPVPAPVVFHGPLELCTRILAETAWKPGVFCDVARLTYSAWAKEAEPWLLNKTWKVMPLATLVHSNLVGEIELDDEIFIRPDSPLKQFSGRVIKRENISLNAVDHGFYYEDTMLSVIFAPKQEITKEWRYVVIGKKAVASSGYDPIGRKGVPSDGPDAVADEIVQHLTVPGDVYAMDLCESRGEVRLLELNPFSGADLYLCSGEAIVKAMADYLA